MREVVRISLGNFAGPMGIPPSMLGGLYSEPEGRFAGHGGGGQSGGGGITPFFCRGCGKTVSPKKVKKSCDVCSKCRSRGRG